MKRPPIRVRTLTPALIAISLLTGACVAQDPKATATVTFYTHGNPVATVLPGVHTGFFCGFVHDGSEKLFSMVDGHLAHNNRYLTLEFAPGEHKFAASFNKHPKDDEYFYITLDPAKHYYFRTTSTTKGVVIAAWIGGDIEETDCLTATIELKTGKVLDATRVKLSPRAVLAIAQTLPTCP